MLRYITDRARPGLVTFYDIQPGNRAVYSYNPQNPHGARMSVAESHSFSSRISLDISCWHRENDCNLLQSPWINV